MDGEISTNTKNTKNDVYPKNNIPNKSVEKSILNFSDERKYIRRYKTHIDNTLKDYMDFVDASLKSNQKDLLSILNETFMQVIEFQSDQLEEIKRKPSHFSIYAGRNPDECNRE